MRLKSFFADSIEEAIRQARQAMGADALLVNSKRSVAEARHLGAYEVVVCAEQDQARSSDAPERMHCSPVSDPLENLSQDVSELRRQMERLALTLARPADGLPGLASDPELARAFARLTDAEFDTDL